MEPTSVPPRCSFGLEFGLCLGGNATFDLGFQPSIALPEKYPYDTPIPLNVLGAAAGNI